MTDIGIDGIVPVAPMTVLNDTPCRKCQYNLRSLPLDGLCPECGTPVSLSVRGDLLRYSDPQWLHSLRMGIWCLFAGILLEVLIYFATVFFARALPSQLFMQIIRMAVEALCFLGGWILTAPDPSGIGEEMYGRSRQVVRVALLIAVGERLLRLVQATAVSPPPIRLILQCVFALMAIAAIVGQFAILNYLRKFAERFPDDKIKTRARFLMFAVGIPYAVFQIEVVIIGFVTRRLLSTNSVRLGLGCSILVAIAALLVFGLIYLIMLAKISQRLHEAEAFARQLWATNEPHLRVQQ